METESCFLFNHERKQYIHILYLHFFIPKNMTQHTISWASTITRIGVFLAVKKKWWPSVCLCTETYCDALTSIGIRNVFYYLKIKLFNYCVIFRHLCLESFFLHPKLLPWERDGLSPHTRLLLWSVLRHSPRPTTALRPVQRPVRGHAPEPWHRAGVPQCPGVTSGSDGDSPEEREARGEPAVSVEHRLEALAAALPLLHQPAL